MTRPDRAWQVRARPGVIASSSSSSSSPSSCSRSSRRSSYASGSSSGSGSKAAVMATRGRLAAATTPAAALRSDSELSDSSDDDADEGKRARLSTSRAPAVAATSTSAALVCPDSQQFSAHQEQQQLPSSQSQSESPEAVRHTTGWHFPTQPSYAQRAVYHANTTASADPMANSQGSSSAAQPSRAGDDEDAEEQDEEEEVFELPPGNQQAVPRAFLLEVAPTPTPALLSRTFNTTTTSDGDGDGDGASSPIAPTSMRRRAIARRSPVQREEVHSSLHPRARSRSSIGSSMSSSSSSHDSDIEEIPHPDGATLPPPPHARTRPRSPQEEWRHSSPPTASSTSAGATAGAEQETDVGQGSLHRGIVVPSSDLEDNADSDDSDGQRDGRLGLGTAARRGKKVATGGSGSACGSANAEEGQRARRASPSTSASVSRSRLLETYSTQAILRRRLPAFCRLLRPNTGDGGAEGVVAATQTQGPEDEEAESDGQGSQGGREARRSQSTHPRETSAVPRPSHAPAAPAREKEAAAEEEEEEEEYDEEAHMRDSAAAAADESLIVAPRASSERRPRQLHSQRRRATRSPSASRSAGARFSSPPAEEEVADKEAAGLRSGSPAAPASATARVELTPPPPTPPPALKDLANQFTFAPSHFPPAPVDFDTRGSVFPPGPHFPMGLDHHLPLEPRKLEARAEQCVHIQIMPWHARLGTRVSRGRGRGRGRGGAAPAAGGRDGAAAAAAAAKEGQSGDASALADVDAKGKGKQKEELPAPDAAATELVDTVDLSADVVDLAAIPLELVRPLQSCPICTLWFPKSRSGPAKRAHLEKCARYPPAASVQDDPHAQRGGSKRGRGKAKVGRPPRAGPLADSANGATDGISNPGGPSASSSSSSQPAPLTPVQVHALISTHLDALISAARARLSAREAAKTLFAHVVGDEAAAEAARAALVAKEARERERRVHLDNLYVGQGELPREYKPRKKRKKRKVGKGKGKGKGKVNDNGEDAEEDTEEEEEVNPALAKLMAKKDAEVAKRREAVLRARSVGEGDEEEEDDDEAVLRRHGLTSNGPDLVATTTDGSMMLLDHNDDEHQSSRSESRSPAKSIVSSTSHTTASSSTSGASIRSRGSGSASASLFAAELGTSLLPARVGRAKAAAYLHQELFPPTQAAFASTPLDDHDGEDGDPTVDAAGSTRASAGTEAEVLLGRGRMMNTLLRPTSSSNYRRVEADLPPSKRAKMGLAGHDGPWGGAVQMVQARRSASPPSSPLLLLQQDHAPTSFGRPIIFSAEGLQPPALIATTDASAAAAAAAAAAGVVAPSPSPSPSPPRAVLPFPPATQRFGRSRLADKYGARRGGGDANGASAMTTAAAAGTGPVLM
ncbi:hypothetical protein OC844_006573 [Tilletia horrida]|nr:hypothetical protein OC844_006573 [Tilletia horrida]